MRYLIFFGVLAFMCACNSNDSVVENRNIANDKNLQVTGEVNFTGDVSNLYEISSSVKLKIGKREILESIDKIEIFADRIYVLNRFGINAGLYAFDINSGAYLGKFGNKDDGVGSYSIPYDFLIDADHKSVEMLTLGKIMRFDLNQFEYKESTPVQFSAVRFKKEGENYYFIRGGWQEPYFTFVNYQENKEYSFIENGRPSHNNYPYNAFIEGYSKTFVQLNYSNQLYRISEKNIFEEDLKVVFDGRLIDQDYINTLQSPQEIREKMASSKIVKEFFFELKDHYYFTFVYKQKQYVKITSKLSEQEITYDVRNVSNSITGEQFPPFIINQKGNQLLAIKSLENDLTEVEHDFEIFILNIKNDIFK